MSIFEITGEGALKLEPAGPSAYGAGERADLQRLLRSQVDIVAPDVLVVGEDVGVGDDSARPIDLLGVDTRGNLVVIDLERGEDRGQLELQAVRHASMLSAMTFEEVIAIYSRHLQTLGIDDSAEDLLLAFLDWDSPDKDRFARDMRIILAAAEFTPDVTRSVLWLNGRGLNIRCVRLRPYSGGTRQFLDVQQIVPVPAAAREAERAAQAAPAAKTARVAQAFATAEASTKAHRPAAAAAVEELEENVEEPGPEIDVQREEPAHAPAPPPAPKAKVSEDPPASGLWFVNLGMEDPDDEPFDTSGRGNIRHWDNCVRYGYIASGGGARQADALRKLESGAHVVAYQKGEGYLGYGVVTRPAEPIQRFRLEGTRTLADTLKQTDYNQSRPDDRWEYAVGVAWRKTFPLNNAKWFKGGFANQNIVCRLVDPETLNFLGEQFGIPLQQS